MKLIERFVDDYSWLIKLGIGILFVMWAGQGFVYALDYLKEEKEKLNKRDFRWEQEVEYKCRLFANEFVKETSVGLYTPDRYYKDLSRLDEKIYELSGDLFFVSGNMSYAREHARNLFHKYINEHRPSKEEISKAASKHGKWMKSGNAIGEEYRKKVDLMSSAEKLDVASTYLSKLFKRGMILSILLYLVRMINRRGILETVLADKKKFVFAILLWPFFIFKYPFNVIREIRVEAELRRLGKAFRQLTKNERELVREIASCRDYKTRLKEFRLANFSYLRRGLALALLATMLAGLASSNAVANIDDPTRGDPVEMSTNFDSVSQDQAVDMYQSTDFVDIWISDLHDFVGRIFFRTKQYSKYQEKPLSGYSPEVFHIPLKSWYLIGNYAIRH